MSAPTTQAPVSAAEKDAALAAKHSDRAKGERRLGLRLALPAFLTMAIVTFYPILNSIWLSLQRYRLTDPQNREFIGLDNYVTIFRSSLFYRDLGATTVITVVTVVVELVIGFAFALVMHRAIFAKKLVRTSILVPYGIITVVSGFAWQFAFDPTLGFLSNWINVLTGGGEEYNFFGHTWSSFLVICLAEIWKTTPFISLLLLAGLATISDDMLEAAQVDGATATQRLFKVIIPNMKSAILVAVLFRTLDAFRIFDNVFVMTAGANGTETLSFLSYNQLVNRVNIGLGSAVSVVLFLLVVLIAYVFVKGFGTDLSQQRGDT